MKNNINNNNSNKVCPKIGIKIHESTNESDDFFSKLKQLSHKNTHVTTSQEDFYNKLKEKNRHTGVRIEEGENKYINDPFQLFNSDPFTNFKSENKPNTNIHVDKNLSLLDLNLENYSIQELYNLFGLDKLELSEENMKFAKKIVLKTHPDKSRLEPKYFLFFSKAYKKLYSIYEFQNKSTNKNINISESDEYEKDNKQILDNYIKNNIKENKKDFNSWFNKQFEKYKLEDNNNGYEEWFKSDKDFIVSENVSKSDMDNEFKKQKTHLKSIVPYTGVNELSSNSNGFALINNKDNYTSGDLFTSNGVSYTDLKQAYTETLIPVTEDDYDKIQKFNTVDDYKKHRQSSSIKPLSKEESLQILYQKDKQLQEESAAAAFYFAKQTEIAKQKQQSFWGELKKLA
jgi:hypothetical protein